MTPPLPSIFTAQTPEQARLLTDFTYYRVLRKLMQGESSAAQIARETGQSVQQVHHKLTRLRAAGLIQVIGEQKRGGRAVKLYRALSLDYRVPFHLTDAAGLGELLLDLEQPVLNEHFRSLGRLVTRHSDGALRVHFTPQGELSAGLKISDGQQSHGSRYALSNFSQRRVSAEVAQELLKRLKDLETWFAEQPEAEGETYTLGLLLSPEFDS